MPDQVQFVESMDEMSTMKAEEKLLHTVRYKSFVIDHGRIPNQRVIIHIYGVKMAPELFQQKLEQAFASNRMFPAEVYHEPDVLIGDARRSGKVGKGVTGSHTILWRKDLSPSMLNWVKNKIAELDKSLGGNGSPLPV